MNYFGNSQRLEAECHCCSVCPLVLYLGLRESANHGAGRNLQEHLGLYWGRVLLDSQILPTRQSQITLYVKSTVIYCFSPSNRLKSHAYVMAEIAVHGADRSVWMLCILFSNRSWIFNSGRFQESIWAGGSQVIGKDYSRGIQVRCQNLYVYPPLDLPFAFTSFQFYGEHSFMLIFR